MNRPRRIAAVAALVAIVTLGVTGIAEASDHSHHGHRHVHGRVGDDIYSSHNSDRYGRDYDTVGGLLWVVGHIL